ncbi:hypothetical protein [Azotobacter beijerinckii]|uniref:Uncharacterized protein n=1 Tax=Azotobacter beijerinckii TaxID=170623 RepID=A0A1I4C2E4_9GAMM|nr:hypothetical protein [Azotobacter beijerinckii]MDV7210767.1 hypothetical protein [Azotobacter beijerinckii]SFB58176.1 hypothetical protein SAMN04244571_03993 [Azotobacter beijerinckii]SFK75244.1 hypothetical protein SAMN04244574_01753 [Azotobacter beijerinckii]
MTVVPFKRRGGEPPREAPQIDRESLVELLGVFIDLSAYIEREHDLHKRVELYGIANRMGAVLHPFTQPPKGAV